MALIYESTYFIVESHERPEIDRREGGHIKISAKGDISDRTELTPQQAIELMRLTIVAGNAMKIAMKKQGVDIGRINYQENGNWKSHLHVHLYCRAVDATVQTYGEPITPGHQAEFEPLREDDIALVREEIIELFQNKVFDDIHWSL